MNDEELTKAIKTSDKLIRLIVDIFNEHKVSSLECLLVCCEILETCRIREKSDEETFDLMFDSLQHVVRKRLKKKGKDIS